MFRRLSLKGPIVPGFVWLTNFELGSGPNKPTNGFVVKTGIYIKMSDVVPLEFDKERN